MRHSRVFSDYNLVDPNTTIGRKKVIGALSAFMNVPAKVQKKMIKAGVEAFTAGGEFPADIQQLIDKMQLGLEEVDTGYEYFFDVRDFSSVPRDGFRIRDAQSGLTFSARGTGGRAKIYKVTGTETTVYFDSYGGGLEFDQAWFQDQEWWTIEENATEFRNAWYRDKATVMYGLIGAIGAGQNVAYDGTGADVMEKDINTINNAAATLITALKDAGYPVTANTMLYILSPIQLKGRLQRALNAQYINAGVSGAALMVEYNIRPVYSTNVLNAGAACTDKWYLGASGMKNKLGEKMPLTVYADFHAQAFATTFVGWGRYGAYANETQFQRLATA